MIQETVRNECTKDKKSQFHQRLTIYVVGVIGGLSLGFGFGFGVTVANKLLSPAQTQSANPINNIATSHLILEPVIMDYNGDSSKGEIIRYTQIFDNQSVMDNLKQDKNPFLGIVGENIGAESAAMYGLSQPGVYVRSVIQGAPADIYGITHSDIIIGFNNESVHNIDQLINLINQCVVGEKSQIIIMRDKKTKLTIDIVLFDYSAQNTQ